MWNYEHAAFWSDPSNSRDRITHHQRTKQRGTEQQEKWTWEDILDGEGPWSQAGEYRRPKEEIKAAKKERRYYEARYAPRDKAERQPQNNFVGGHTGSLAESGWRPEPTPRAYRGERVTGQAPYYAVMRTVSSGRVHRPVRSVPVPCISRARLSIQPERVVPALRSRSPVRLHGPVYPVPVSRTRPEVRVTSLAPPMPAPRIRPPVRMPSPECPVPAPCTRPEVRVTSLAPPMPVPCIRIPATVLRPELSATVPRPELPATVPHPELPATVPRPELPATVPRPELPATVPRPERPATVLQSGTY
jgi:hypothetical protein